MTTFLFIECQHVTSIAQYSNTTDTRQGQDFLRNKSFKHPQLFFSIPPSTQARQMKEFFLLCLCIVTAKVPCCQNAIAQWGGSDLPVNFCWTGRATHIEICRFLLNEENFRSVYPADVGLMYESCREGKVVFFSLVYHAWKDVRQSLLADIITLKSDPIKKLSSPLTLQVCYIMYIALFSPALTLHLAFVLRKSPRINSKVLLIARLKFCHAFIHCGL